MAFVSKDLRPVRGINGVVKDGIVSGYYGYDAGQPCAGDMLDWFIRQQVPVQYFECAGATEQNIHAYLSGLAAKRHPWENALTALDWFNGNRSILNDQALRGAVAGYSLQTQAEDVYCALVQGLACGTRKILDFLAENGLVYDRIILCGGIAEKNPFVLEQYANVLGRPVHVSQQRQVTALSASILAAIAAGIPPQTATEQMINTDFRVIHPDSTHAKEYERIYRRWEKLHNLLADYYREDS